MPQSRAALRKLLSACEKQLTESEIKLTSVSDESEVSRLMDVIIDLQNSRGEITAALTDGGEIKHAPE